MHTTVKPCQKREIIWWWGDVNWRTKKKRRVEGGPSTGSPQRGKGKRRGKCVGPVAQKNGKGKGINRK